MANRISEEDADRFIWQLKLVIGGIIAFFVIPLIIYAVYMDRRLNDFEQSLRPTSPDELTVDDLDRNDLFDQSTNRVEGQMVYVPAYSHIYSSQGKPILLTITLSVRNTSMDSEIVVDAVRYFNTNGEEVKSYLKKPVRLPRLGTTEVVVERDDITGGSGANFLVEWRARQPVSAPIVESVMVDTKSQQGLAFGMRGTAIRDFISRPESGVSSAGE